MANIAAPMGYMATVRLFGLDPIRASSCSLNMKQAIEHPDVIDGTVDWTLYQLKGIECEGDVRLPISADPSATSGISNLFDICTVRDMTTGELINSGDVVVVYGSGNQALQANSRTFHGCKINTFEMKATAGEIVEATMGIWGATVDIGSGARASVSGKPVRCLSWADIILSGPAIGEGCQVKEFSLNIANNLQRNYTFCPASGYFPNNISTGKRHISGSLGFQGWAPTEASEADQNRNKTNPTPGVGLTIAVGGFSKSFLNVIFEYQTIEAQPTIITSTVNWYAHASGGGVAFS